MNTFSKLMLSPINHLKANIINKQQLVSIWILIKKTQEIQSNSKSHQKTETTLHFISYKL